MLMPSERLDNSHECYNNIFLMKYNLDSMEKP